MTCCAAACRARPVQGCLRRMRHTKSILDVPAGRVLPSAKAFKQPPPKPTPQQLASWRNKLLMRHERVAAAEVAQRRVAAAMQAAEEEEDLQWQQQSKLRQRLLRVSSHDGAVRATGGDLTA